MMKKLENEVDNDNETYQSTTNEEGNDNSIGMRSSKDENEIFFHPNQFTNNIIYSTIIYFADLAFILYKLNYKTILNKIIFCYNA